MNTVVELAWAAGLFDGEGSVSTYLPKNRRSRRRQMQVSQAGIEGEKPSVLLRFQEIVGGLGNITGPYRGYLYYWKITSKDDVDEVGRLLWPYLGTVKRRQFEASARDVGRRTPASVGRRRRLEPEVEAAWAAGLFDGEGTVATSGRAQGRWRSASLSLPQSSAAGVPENLTRFRGAVTDIGCISGPHPPRSPWSRLPQYVWSTTGRHKATATARVLWPNLGPVKRDRLTAVASLLDSDPSAW